MKNNEVRFKVIVTTDGKRVKEITTDFSSMQRAVLQASGALGALEHNFKSLSRHLGLAAKFAAAFYTVKTAIKETIVEGIRLNKTIEDASAGIAALVAANTKGADAFKRFEVAMGMSEVILQKLKRASIETSATFPQLTEIFQQAIGGALGAGKSFGKSVDEIIANTIKLSQRMSNIAGSIGMPMQQVNEEIRSIIEGTIDQNSRIAKMLHITNEEVKRAKESVGGLSEYLEKKFASFDALAGIDTYSRALARLQDRIDSLRVEISKPIFNDLKEEFKSLSKWLADNKDEIVFYAKTIYFWGKKIGVAIGDLVLRPVQIVWNLAQMAVEGAAKDIELIVQAAENGINAIVWLANKIPGIHLYKVDFGAKKRIAALNKSLQEDWDDIKRAWKEMSNIFDDLERIEIEYTKSVMDNAKKRTSAHNLELNGTKKGAKEQESELKKQKETFEKMLEAKQCAYEEYLAAVGKKEELFWAKEGDKLNKLLLDGIDMEKALEILEADRKRFLEATKQTAVETKDVWNEASMDMARSIERNFFDFVTGRFRSLKDFLANLLNDIASNLLGPFSRQLAGMFSGVMVPSFENIAGNAMAAPQQAGTLLGMLKNPTSIVQAMQMGVMSPFVNFGTNLSSLGFMNAGSAVTSFGVGLANPFNLPAIIASQGGWGSLAGAAAGTGGMLAAGGIGFGMGKIGDLLFGAETKAALYGAIGAAIGSIIPGVGTLIGGAIGSLIGGLFGKWKVKEQGLIVLDTLQLGNIDAESIQNYAWKKKKSWFSSKKKTDKLGISQSELLAIRSSFIAFEDVLSSFGDDISMTLERGRLKIDKNVNEFDEYLSKEFLSHLMGVDESIEKLKPIFEGKYKEFDGETLMLVERYFKGRIGWIDSAIKKAATDAEKEELESAKADLMHLREVYDAWEAYAKEQKKSVSEALQEAFAKVAQEKEKFEAFKLDSYGIDGSAVVDAKNAVHALGLSFQTLEESLQSAGVEVDEIGDVTAENFQSIYDAVLRNDPTPQTIEALNRFGDALLAVESKARSVADAIDSYFGNIEFGAGYEEPLGELVQKYFSQNESDPRKILKLLDGIELNKTYKIGEKEYSGSQILARFEPYIGKLIQDAKILDDGLAAYNAQLLQLKEKSAKTLEEMIAAERMGVDIAAHTKEQAEKELKKARELVGIVDLTAENFGYYYQKALEANPSIEEIRKWEMAKTAILNAANANEAYADSLRRVAAIAAQAKQSYWQSVEAASDSFEALLAKVEESQRSSSQNIVQAGENFASSVSSAAKSYADALKSASSSLEGMIAKLQGDIGGASYSEAKFYSYLDLAKTALGRGDYANYSEYVSKLSGYIGFLDQKSYTSTAEAKFEKAYVLNQLKELKSPTDLMLEQLSAISQNTAATSGYSSQIAANTFGTQEQVYALVHESLGGRKFDEVVRDGVIEGLRGDGLTAVLGQSLQNIETQLANSNAYWQQVPLANGKIGVLVDFDQDGVNDLTLAFDSSGVLQAIDTNTAKNYETIQKVFGDQNIGEVIKDGVIQGVYGENFSISLGDTLALVQSSLSTIDASYQQFGDTLKVDFDHDGAFDVALQFDATGHLQAIKDNTGAMVSLLELYKQAKSDNVITNTELQTIGSAMKENDYIIAPGGVPVGKETVQEWANQGYDLNYFFPGFATGGYTGDGHPLEPAGLVHKGEFVVNAPTTRILGLNRDNGGVFLKMLEKIGQMADEIARLNARMERLERYTKETAENTQPIKENERWGV